MPRQVTAVPFFFEKKNRINKNNTKPVNNQVHIPLTLQLVHSSRDEIWIQYRYSVVCNAFRRSLFSILDLFGVEIKSAAGGVAIRPHPTKTMVTLLLL